MLYLHHLFNIYNKPIRKIWSACHRRGNLSFRSLCNLPKATLVKGTPRTITQSCGRPSPTVLAPATQTLMYGGQRSERMDRTPNRTDMTPVLSDFMSRSEDKADKRDPSGEHEGKETKPGECHRELTRTQFADRMLRKGLLHKVSSDLRFK